MQLAFKIAWFALPAASIARAPSRETADPAARFCGPLSRTFFLQRLPSPIPEALPSQAGRKEAHRSHVSFMAWELASLDVLPVTFMYNHPFNPGVFSPTVKETQRIYNIFGVVWGKW